MRATKVGVVRYPAKRLDTENLPGKKAGNPLVRPRKAKQNIAKYDAYGGRGALKGRWPVIPYVELPF